MESRRITLRRSASISIGASAHVLSIASLWLVSIALLFAVASTASRADVNTPKFMVGPLSVSGPDGEGGDTIQSVQKRLGPEVPGRHCEPTIERVGSKETKSSICGKRLTYRDAFGSVITLTFWGDALFAIDVVRNYTRRRPPLLARGVAPLDKWRWNGITILNPNPPAAITGCKNVDPGGTDVGWGCGLRAPAAARA